MEVTRGCHRDSSALEEAGGQLQGSEHPAREGTKPSLCLETRIYPEITLSDSGVFMPQQIGLCEFHRCCLLRPKGA